MFHQDSRYSKQITREMTFRDLSSVGWDVGAAAKEQSLLFSAEPLPSSASFDVNN